MYAVRSERFAARASAGRTVYNDLGSMKYMNIKHARYRPRATDTCTPDLSPVCAVETQSDMIDKEDSLMLTNGLAHTEGTLLACDTANRKT